MSQLPSSVEVLTNVRQGPQRAEIATVTKLYTKLWAVSEADYLKYISASFYQMVEPAWKQNKIAKQHYIFTSFPQLSPETDCFCCSQMHWINKYKVQLLTRNTTFPQVQYQGFVKFSAFFLFFPIETVKRLASAK